MEASAGVLSFSPEEPVDFFRGYRKYVNQIPIWFASLPCDRFRGGSQIVCEYNGKRARGFVIDGSHGIYYNGHGHPLHCRIGEAHGVFYEEDFEALDIEYYREHPRPSTKLPLSCFRILSPLELLAEVAD